MVEVINNISKFALPIFIFYILIFGGFILEIIGCNLQHVLKENIYAKHFIGILLLFFLVIIVDPTYAEENLIKNIGITLVIYTWFLITTRSPINIMILILLFILCAYLASIAKERYIKDENEDATKKAQLLQNIFAMIALLLSFIGFGIYLYEKKMEYKDEFSFHKFIFGTVKCREYTPEAAKFSTLILGNHQKSNAEVNNKPVNSYYRSNTFGRQNVNGKKNTRL